MFSSKVVVESEVMAGAAFTVRVKVCEASGLTPLVAVMVIGYAPRVLGCWASRPVWPSRHRCRVKVTPLGSAPDSESEAVG